MNLKEKIYDWVVHPVRREIYIPELEETIYFTPMTVLEMEKIMTLSGSGASSKDFHIWTIIEKVEDTEGKKVFTVEDRPYLEKMDWIIISRISNEIHRFLPAGELKKN